MENHKQVSAPAMDVGAIEHQVGKGLGLLLLCLERGRSLSMKGFIDSQIEKGAEFVPVVERVAGHIVDRLEHAETREQRALLLDLRNYADVQLQAAHAIRQLPPAEY